MFRRQREPAPCDPSSRVARLRRGERNGRGRRRRGGFRFARVFAAIPAFRATDAVAAAFPAFLAALRGVAAGRPLPAKPLVATTEVLLEVAAGTLVEMAAAPAGLAGHE